jgi:hypothetical protein
VNAQASESSSAARFMTSRKDRRDLVGAMGGEQRHAAEDLGSKWVQRLNSPVQRNPGRPGPGKGNAETPEIGMIGVLPASGGGSAGSDPAGAPPQVACEKAFTASV